MSIITNPETNQQPLPTNDDEFAWSHLSAIYLEGNEQVRIQLYFHPIHRPLKFYLNGEEAVLVPVSKTANNLEVTNYATRYRT